MHNTISHVPQTISFDNKTKLKIKFQVIFFLKRAYYFSFHCSYTIIETDQTKTVNIQITFIELKKFNIYITQIFMYFFKIDTHHSVSYLFHTQNRINDNMVSI